MSTVLTQPAPLTEFDVAFPRSNRTANTTERCLVLTSDASRSELFATAAEQGGWDAHVFDDVRVAHRAAFQFRHGLIIADVSTDDSPERRQAIEQLAQASGALVMVCGCDGDALQEIWARGFGAWIYLAGVDASCDLTSLCGEALEVNEKLNPSLRATA